LEDARGEIVRRLTSHDLPTSISVTEFLVIDNADATGHTGTAEEVPHSSLLSHVVASAVGDESVESRSIGLRPQLEPLAHLLAETTCLGALAPSGFGSAAAGTENALVGYVLPLAWRYLACLSDLAEPAPSLVEALGDELDALVERRQVLQRVQIPLDGIRVSVPMGPYREVSVRPLTPSERGAYIDREMLSASRQTLDAVVPRVFSHFSPRVLVEYVGTRGDESSDSRQLPNRLALAFFLRGHDIASPGAYVKFGEPRWADVGNLHSPFPVDPKPTNAAPFIDWPEFTGIVDLACAMPVFSGEEGSRQEVALFRVLRGCGAAKPGFLDFAIALEAALLGGEKNELAYKFRLRGALYLRPEREPAATFDQLKQVYNVRSDLVHGTGVSATKLHDTSATARDLALAVTKKAVETGWPEGALLDRAALAADPERTN